MTEHPITENTACLMMLVSWLCGVFIGFIYGTARTSKTNKDRFITDGTRKDQRGVSQ